VEVAVVGAGIGGLTAASLLAWQGKNVLVLESHYRPGGAAHGFTARTEEGQFAFDTGPSFYAGLDSPGGLNPLASVLAVLDEPLDTVQYNPSSVACVTLFVACLRALSALISLALCPP
jgi:phytoene dehydrogenase-like protein